MNKTTIKIAYVDGLERFSVVNEQWFSNRFSQKYHLIRDTDNPDVVVYSCFGTEHQKYEKALRIFFTGENIKPDYNACDYSLGTVKLDYRGKHLWVPLAVILGAKMEIEIPTITPELARRPFCSFIYSQSNIGEGAVLRKKFCEALMREYKHVDCPGRVLHNLDAPELADRFDGANWNTSKQRFLSKYKFNIAFENSAAPGYITEKLTDAYLGNTVPIYWGSDGDTAPYPKESMICANDYPTPEALIARIKEVDENDELYLSMLAANPMRPENCHRLPDFDRQITDFLQKAVEERIMEHRETRTTHFGTLYRELAVLRQNPYVRAALKIQRGVRRIKRLLGLRRA